MSARIRLLQGNVETESRVYHLDDFRFEARLSAEERRLLSRLRSLQELLREKEALLRALRGMARGRR